ncbi:STT3 domain-containing protein, partial [Candidatus Omnitrophota bacterium]
MERRRAFFFCFLFLLATGLNIHLRLFPAYFPQLKNQARVTVDNEIFEEVSSRAEEQFSDYNPLIRAKIVGEFFAERKKEPEVAAKIAAEYAKLKGRFQDDNGQTYLLELDPYSWMRFTRLTLANGYPGNEIRDGKVYDTYMLAPVGASVYSIRFLYYSSAFLYRAATLVFSGISLERFLFYLPLLFVFLLCVCLYRFCRVFFSGTTAVLALIFVGLTPSFIPRSCVGWFDNDVLNILFPLLTIFSLGLGLRQSKTAKNILFSLLAAFFLSLYAYTWRGWWFIYLVIFAFFGYVLLNIVNLHYKDKDIVRAKTFPYLVSLLTFFLGSIVLCLAIAKIEPLSYTFLSIKENLGLGKSLASSIWPSTYYTVGELQPINFLGIPIALGGWIVFTLSLVSSLWVYLLYKRTEKGDLIVLLIFWLFSMIFASLKGARFTILLCLPVGIFLSLGIDRVVQIILARVAAAKDKKTKIVLVITCSLMLYFFINPAVRRGFAMAENLYPSMNDEWHGFLDELRDSTPEDAVINSWWDFGSWFKEVARRRVIFDGLSQDRPLAYWMGRALLTTDEREALRILRMVNNSSESLFEEVAGETEDAFTAIVLLDRLLKADTAEADGILAEYSLSQELKARIKDTLFFKRPAPAYVV